MQDLKHDSGCPGAGSNMQGAANIGGNENVGIGCLDGVKFVIAQQVGHVGVVDHIAAGRTATLVVAGQRNDLQCRDAFEQGIGGIRFFQNISLAAGFMHGNLFIQWLELDAIRPFNLAKKGVDIADRDL